ncbi:uncharacterized, partial [Tachysurus ichikawai]
MKVSELTGFGRRRLCRCSGARHMNPQQLSQLLRNEIHSTLPFVRDMGRGSSSQQSCEAPSCHSVASMATGLQVTREDLLLSFLSHMGTSCSYR